MCVDESLVLIGLSDDSEGVREVALRGGQVMVSSFGRLHALELLPSLKDGMFHADWRIRQSSVTLLGELLYLVGDTRAVGVADTEDDDDDGGAGVGLGASRVAITIRAHIGEKETDSVLASLYIVRSDSSITVRQIALQVWKSVVSNTPRTLRDIMPILVAEVIEKLSSNSVELRGVTGRALGEVIRKLGDHVLPEIVPHLRSGMNSDEEAIRQGVCLGLAEVINAASARQIESYVDTLMPALQQALCDGSVDVRTEAARGFVTLLKTIGEKAIEEVVPQLLLKITDDGDDDSGMRGLQEVVKARPRDLLEFLIPRLMASPMSQANARVLSVVAKAGAGALIYHIPIIVHRSVAMHECVGRRPPPINSIFLGS